MNACMHACMNELVNDRFRAGFYVCFPLFFVGRTHTHLQTCDHTFFRAGFFFVCVFVTPFMAKRTCKMLSQVFWCGEMLQCVCLFWDHFYAVPRVHSRERETPCSMPS